MNGVCLFCDNIQRTWQPAPPLLRIHQILHRLPRAPLQTLTCQLPSLLPSLESPETFEGLSGPSDSSLARLTDRMELELYTLRQEAL